VWWDRAVGPVRHWEDEKEDTAREIGSCSGQRRGDCRRDETGFTRALLRRYARQVSGETFELEYETSTAEKSS
jgi:hypothetical protein